MRHLSTTKLVVLGFVAVAVALPPNMSERYPVDDFADDFAPEIEAYDVSIAVPRAARRHAQYNPTVALETDRPRMSQRNVRRPVMIRDGRRLGRRAPRRSYRAPRRSYRR